MGLFSKYTEGYKAEEQPKAVPPTTESTTPTVLVEPEATAPVVSKPSWMADDDYKEAMNRYSPEEINKIYDGYDPSSTEPFYQTLYKMNARKPKQVSEKSIKARRSLAGVSDALSLMVRGISAGSGAHISKQTGPTSMDTENEKIQRLRNVYKVDQDRYDAGLFDNSMRDVELGRAEHGRKRADLRTVLRDLRNRKYADKKMEKQLEYKAAMDVLDRKAADNRLSKEFEYKVASDALDRKSSNDKLSKEFAYETASAAQSHKYDNEILSKKFEHESTRDDKNNVFEQSQYERNATERERHNKAVEGISLNKAKASNNGDIDGDTAPRGYVDLVDTNRGRAYRISETKLKHNIAQLYNLIEPQILKEDEDKLHQRIDKYEEPTINEKTEMVKRYMYDFDNVIEMVEKMSDKVIKDSDLIIKKAKEEENPIVVESRPTYNGPLRPNKKVTEKKNNPPRLSKSDIDSIGKMNNRDEVKEYLNKQGRSKEEIDEILKYI